MDQKWKQIWAQINSILLFILMLSFVIWPECLFVHENTTALPNIFILIVFTSAATFLFVIFISSFIIIQRSRECRGDTIFLLLGSLFSILFFMIVKVMADELAREWLPETGKIYGHGEFWIMLVCLGFVLGFKFYVGMIKQNR